MLICETSELVKSPQLISILKAPILAASEIQVAIATDFSQLVTQLLTSAVGETIHGDLIKLLVETIDLSLSNETDPILFLGLVTVLEKQIKTEVVKLESQDFSILLKSLSKRLPEIGKLSSNALGKSEIIRATLSLLCSIFKSPSVIGSQSQYLANEGNHGNYYNNSSHFILFRNSIFCKAIFRMA